MKHMNYQDLLDEWKLRRKRVLEMNRKGKSYSEIAAKFNITYPRVSEIVRKAREEENEGQNKHP
jgi:transposase